MKKIIAPLLIITLIFSILLVGCGKTTKAENTTTTAVTTTKKPPAKYAESKYLGTWYNASATKDELVCTLKEDGTAIFKEDKKASWEETPAGITLTATIDGKKATMDGYFVIVGEGYVARATDANMHYLDEGGTLQLEIMLTETTCVDCVKKL